ncbi:MAG: hypothetical protein ACRCS0_12935 [Albidovulum sp.]
MAVFDNSYSRIIFWLKIILPLLALAVLSTLFLFSSRIDIEGSLPFSEVDVEQLAREQRLTQPEYSAVTDDGSALRINAAVARPQVGATGVASARELVVRYETTGGLNIDLTSKTGRLDDAKGEMILRDGVTIKTSSGYDMVSPGLDAALDRTRLVSQGAVTATGPLGRIDAGHMEITRADAATGDYVLIFNQGVKLVYQPVD